ncbi:N-6 DNA methylase [Ruminococcaceae bacterium OttesenSCG-928-A16]|nr:N-6 DNA methylase [Ruminococcaceae bacterium OttesenSCG-928-A16]
MGDVEDVRRQLEKRSSRKLSNILHEVERMATAEYFTYSKTGHIPISWNTCSDLSSYIIARKLGIIGLGNFNHQSFQELQKLDKSFDKGFQWINRIAKNVYLQLDTILKEELKKNEKTAERQQPSPDEFLQPDGYGIFGSERAGRAERPITPKQLNFGDVAFGRGTTVRGTPPERNQEAGATGKNSTAAGRSHGRDQTVSADRERNTRGNQPVVQRTNGRVDTASEGAVAGVLQVAADNGLKPTSPKNGFGGPKTKYKNNVLAIKVLQNVEAGQRTATLAEQKVMKRYTGWGGIPEVFEEGRAGWEKEHSELKSLLPDAEYAQARRSTLNAHYTQPEIIQAIYAGLDGLGFNGGRLLDPSAGNARFFSELPDHWQKDLHAVELDTTSGRLTAAIHPNAKVHIMGYQDVKYPDNYFDGIISNIPFGSYGVPDERYNKHNWSIHEYFFGKSLDKVKPGGVIAFITSKYLMDKKNNSFRKYVAQRAELVAAIRLPANTFWDIAKTEVTTDILILKKREQEVVWEQDWVHLGLTADGVPVNEYYLSHPEHLLGQMVFDKSFFGNETDTACFNLDPEFSASKALNVVFSAITENDSPVFTPVTITPIPKPPTRRNSCHPAT